MFIVLDTETELKTSLNPSPKLLSFYGELYHSILDEPTETLNSTNSDQIVAFLKKADKVVGWNVAYDEYVIYNHLANHGKVLKPIRFVCIKTVFNEVFDILGFERLKSLKVAAEMYGISNENHHDAENDVKVTFQLYKKLYEFIGESCERSKIST